MKTILVANQKGGCGKTLTAITLASALAHRGYKVCLADTDQQQSSLTWLKQRSTKVPEIRGVDWTSNPSFSDIPKKTDWLIIDSQGRFDLKTIKQLIAESDVLLIPIQPSFFDLDSSKHFRELLNDVKRVRKNKIDIIFIVNRFKATKSQMMMLDQYFTVMQQTPIAYIQDRSAYDALNMQGLTIFDKNQQHYLLLQQQWQPLLQYLLRQNYQENTEDWF